MKDLFESLKTQIHTRISSPFFGAFLISWICWNHRYLLILFSDIPVQERFILAQKFVYPDRLSIVNYGLGYPLITSVAFILMYPYPSRWLFGYWHRQEMTIKKLRDEIEGAALLTKEESQKLLVASIEQKEAYEELLSKQAAQIEALRARKPREPQVESVRVAKEQMPTPVIADPLDKYDDATRQNIRKILTMLGEKGVGYTEKSIVLHGMKMPPIRVEHLFDKLRDTGLVEESGEHYRLNKLGRNYVILHNLVP